MIENIRKYNGLIILSLVLVIIALVIGLQSSMVRNSIGGHPYLKVDGRTYTDQEFQRLGQNGLEVIMSLAQSGDFNVYEYVMELTSGAKSESDMAEKFFIGRMLIREAKKDFGIHPSDEQISNFIRGMQAFTDKDKQFSIDRYRQFIQKGIGRLGLTENDFRDLVSDMLATDHLRSIVGSGLAPDAAAIQQMTNLNAQQIDGSLAKLELSSFTGNIKPSDDELRKYWELIQDQFKTEPLRKFSYVIATPDMPAEDSKPEEAKDTIASATMSDEAKAAADKAKADKAAKLAETRRKKQAELDSMVDDFTFLLEEHHGEGFEENAKKNHWEIKSTELFSRTSPPKDLDLKLRGSNSGGSAVDELFRIEPTSDPLSKISQPIAIGENQWLVARLEAEEKSRTKTFDEAKADVLAQYTHEKSVAAMKKAADEAATKIRTALAAGKSFDDAARDAGIQDTTKFSKVTASYRPDPMSQPANLFDAARTVDPGTLATPIVESEAAYLLMVSAREVVKLDKDADRLKAQLDTSLRQNEFAGFADWLSASTEAAKVERLYRR